VIISDSKKFLFFHIPKTAGQSISRGLLPYTGNTMKTFLSKFYSPTRKHDFLNYNHVNQTIALDIYPELKDICQNFFEFAFDRNPYPRVLSMYGQIKKNEQFTGVNYNLNKFINELQKYNDEAIFPINFNSQLFWLNNPLTDKIHYFKMENLSNNWTEISHRLDIIFQLPFINKNPFPTDIKQLSGKQRLIIYNLYKAEFERFDYPK
jgi:hypothetical protein